METENSSILHKTRHAEDVDLAEYRKRYNRLLLAFKLFFISLILITLTIITYLVQSESLDDSIHRNPPSPQIYNSTITTTESEIFNLYLTRAAEELERATSLILSAANKEAKNELAFNSCRRWPQIGAVRLREVIRDNQSSEKLSDKKRIEMANRIVAVEEIINSCLDDLAAAKSSAAADEAREVVAAAADYLSERGDFLMSYRDKMLRKLWETVRDMILENMIVICICGFQMMFVSFLFWRIFKSR